MDPSVPYDMQVLYRRSRRSAVLALAFLLVGCATQPVGIGKAVSWSKLTGWAEDQQAAAWPALIQSCTRLAGREPDWTRLCAEVELLGSPSDEAARAFFETRFVPHRVVGDGGKKQGLITGYYEPLLAGSFSRDERFRYPIYGPPPNLLTIELGGVFPELRGRSVRGRLQGKRVVPYFSRAEIENGEEPLAGHELLWVDDPVELFFLQVQGSGRVRLPDGQEIAVGYADQNGHPYVSIGKRLLERTGLKPEEMTLETIREWLNAHPEEVRELLHSNPSYVFFALRDSEVPGPLGSLNVPLTAGRSIAVDPRHVMLGLPVWLDTRFPDGEQVMRRLVLAQDTGGAIKGPLRADVFFGAGREAERLAGRMRQSGRLYVLLPAPPAAADKGG